MLNLGNGLVERLAAINVSKGTKTVTLNDALPDRPEATRGALLYHIHRRVGGVRNSPTTRRRLRRSERRHKSTHMLKGREGREREEEDED